MNNNNVVEFLVGAIVLAVAGLFLFYAYTTAGGSDVSGYQLQAEFDRVDGLSIGSDVRVSGIKVGVVLDESLDSENYLALVSFSVDSNVQLPIDSSVKIAMNGIFGGSYLSIQPGGSDEMLADGDSVLFTQGSVDLIGLLGQAVFSAGGGEGETTP